MKIKLVRDYHLEHDGINDVKKESSLSASLTRATLTVSKILTRVSNSMSHAVQSSSCNISYFTWYVDSSGTTSTYASSDALINNNNIDAPILKINKFPFHASLSSLQHYYCCYVQNDIIIDPSFNAATHPRNNNDNFMCVARPSQIIQIELHNFDSDMNSTMQLVIDDINHDSNSKDFNTHAEIVITSTNGNHNIYLSGRAVESSFYDCNHAITINGLLRSPTTNEIVSCYQLIQRIFGIKFILTENINVKTSALATNVTNAINFHYKHV